MFKEIHTVIYSELENTLSGSPEMFYINFFKINEKKCKFASCSQKSYLGDYKIFSCINGNCEVKSLR